MKLCIFCRKNKAVALRTCAKCHPDVRTDGKFVWHVEYPTEHFRLDTGDRQKLIGAEYEVRKMEREKEELYKKSWRFKAKKFLEEYVLPIVKRWRPHDGER